MDTTAVAAPAVIWNWFEPAETPIRALKVNTPEPKPDTAETDSTWPPPESTETAGVTPAMDNPEESVTRKMAA